MGIVVCVSQLLGLLVYLTKHKTHKSRGNVLRFVGAQSTGICWLLAGIGTWNFLWYGLQHGSSFWGQAAIGSGVFMLLAAAAFATVESNSSALASRVLSHVQDFLRPIKLLIVWGLLASFLLYAITLMQLNLGMPIVS